MKNWQKERNYRKYKNADGSFTYIITVDGEGVKVDVDVYKAYSQADRRERYCYERDEGRLLSLDRMDEDGVSLSYLTKRYAESAEDTAVRNLLIEQARTVLPLLDNGSQELIQRLYFDGISIRKYAKEKGLSDFAIRHRERKVLMEIEKLLGK